MSRDLLELVFRETIHQLNPAAVTAQAIAAANIEEFVTLIAAGKAAASMTRGALSVLGERVFDGCIVVPHELNRPMPMTVLVATHPTPSAASVRAGEALLAAVASGRRVVALISGGASALACVPAPGVSLADKLEVTGAVMRAGAPIEKLNTVRKHLSAIKGGQLAEAATAPVTTFALSDVVGDRLTDIASGPTVPDPTSRDDARCIIEQFAPEHASISSSLVATPKVARQSDSALVIAGTGTLIDTAVEVARGNGLDTAVGARDLTGDVTHVADQLAAIQRTGCVVAGGEPTIALPTSPGTGGRAHHLALLIAQRIRGQTNTHVLVAGSDGIDGNTDAAGAIVDGTTWQRVADPESALATANAGSALAAIGASLVTGPTGVNHADLIVMLRTN